jgi:hypothetical protein
MEWGGGGGCVVIGVEVKMRRLGGCVHFYVLYLLSPLPPPFLFSVSF